MNNKFFKAILQFYSNSFNYKKFIIQISLEFIYISSYRKVGF